MEDICMNLVGLHMSCPICAVDAHVFASYCKRPVLHNDFGMFREALWSYRAYHFESPTGVTVHEQGWLVRAGSEDDQFRALLSSCLSPLPVAPSEYASDRI